MIHNHRKIRLNVLVAKAVVYRILAFVAQSAVLYLLTEDLQKALCFSLVLETMKTLCYFAYDFVFAKMHRVSTDKGYVLWFTGLPCSGKTTLADAVAEVLRSKGAKVERLDGDIVRKSLTADLGFSEKDREENLKRVGFVAKVLHRNGVAVLCSFVSPYRNVRRRLREQFKTFIEVHVKCSVQECEKRDVKGKYALVRKGIIKGFTGIDAPYEEPENAEIVVDTDKESIEESVYKIVQFLRSRKLI